MDSSGTVKKTSFLRQIIGLPANFWYANFMEILERLAFFGVRAIAPLYLVVSADQNGLGLSFSEKGDVFMWWALLQCLVPMVSGGYTERYGYRKSLAVAFVLNIIGYLGMAKSFAISNALIAQGWEGAPYGVFLVAACFVAVGTAIFKPAVHGTIAKATTEETSSMGWGVFYWIVNIGGALAPMCAAPLRGEFNWHYVFYAAAIVTALNFLPAFLLYKEPEKVVSADGDEKGPLQVFVSSILTVFKDLRLVVFLLIFSCFWLMFMQLWDLLPNFVDEWVNTADVAPYYSFFSSNWLQANGQVKPEMIININPWSIILLVIPLSWLVGRINKVAAMVVGMLISLVGFLGCGSVSVGILCVLMLLIFSIGEMTCSPTFSAYVGLIAPKDKKALYMGYSNIPFAIGWAAGNGIGGRWYETMSSKFNLAREYMVQNLGVATETVENLDGAELMETMAAAMNGGAGATVEEATKLLWNTYHPYMVWYYLGAFGLVGTIGMVIFYFATRKSMAAERAAQTAD